MMKFLSLCGMMKKSTMQGRKAMAKCEKCGKRRLFLKVDANGNCQQCALEIKRHKVEAERAKVEEEIAKRRKKKFEEERESAIRRFEAAKFECEVMGKSLTKKVYDKLWEDDYNYNTGFQNWYLESDDVVVKYPKPRIGSMSIETIAEKLVEDEKYNTSFAKELEEYNKRRENRERKKHEKFDKIWKLHEKAHSMEREGDLEGALEIYLKNLKNHPDGTVYFDRPCIVLEKLGRYEEAIELCNQALERIDKKKMNCDSDSYYKRRDRLRKKIEKRYK